MRWETHSLIRSLSRYLHNVILAVVLFNRAAVLLDRFIITGSILLESDGKMLRRLWRFTSYFLGNDDDDDAAAADVNKLAESFVDMCVYRN